jgi:hypothetical protein
MKTLTKVERRLRQAGTLIVLGLMVELVSLRWSHPTAFLLFILLGATLMGLGILSYLLTLLIAGKAEEGEKDVAEKYATQ